MARPGPKNLPVAIYYRLVVSRVGIRLWKRYRENGKLYEAGKYVDGKQIAIWKHYDAVEP